MSQPEKIRSDSMQQMLTADFYASTGLNSRSGIVGADYSTFRIGGLFENFIEADSENDISSALKWIISNGQRLNILGAGSNLLLDSDGIPGWTIRLGRTFRRFERKSGSIFAVGAAYPLTTLARELSTSGYSGLEFAAGIPASVGGAARMNAGAHGGEMSSIIKAVQGFTSSGEYQELSSSELNFSYRSVSLPENFMITSVLLALTEGDSNTILSNLLANLEYRKRTQPLSMPSAGSIFRNPGSSPERSAGAIIDRLGLKGKTEGFAEISQLHANWIVNPAKKAHSGDVIKLIRLCQSSSLSQLSEALQTELVIW